MTLLFSPTMTGSIDPHRRMIASSLSRCLFECVRRSASCVQLLDRPANDRRQDHLHVCDAETSAWIRTPKNFRSPKYSRTVSDQ
jgi:hypothetical protein